MPWNTKPILTKPVLLRLVLLRLAVLALSCVAPPLAMALELPELMRLLATNKGGKADFVERKYIAQLSNTVESSGELVFIPPHRLERRTIKPKEESIVLDQDTLTWSRGKTQRVIALNDYPEFSVLATSIRASLSGDQKTLLAHYKITVDGSATDWKLGLTPKQARVANKVHHIQISGSQAHASKVDFALADGDYSTMFVSKSVAP